MKKYLRIIICIAITIVCAKGAYCQSVGIGTSTFIPDSKSILDIRASAMGLLIPRMAWASVPTGLTSAQDGLIIYCTDGDGTNGNGFYYYDGSAATWKKLFGGTTTGDYIKNQTSQQSGANFNISGNGYIGGNVGIGTATPGGKLDLNGGAFTLSNSYIDINRDGFVNNGISWYSQSYPSWSTYMSPASQAATGPHGDLTAPSGTFVTSWALRNYIENSAGYGWTFESAANSTTPAVKFEIRSSDGLFHSYGDGIIDGNVGIGTTTPSSKLDVNGVANAATGYRVANTAASGSYLRGNGTNFVSSAIQVADVPTLNQNTTGWATYLKSPFPYNVNISDGTTAQSLCEPGSLTSVNMHSGHGYFGSWATTLTMSGYDRYGAYQISGNYNSATPELAIRNFVQGPNTWNSWVKLITSANIGSQAVSYANLADIPTRTNWVGIHRGFVAEQLSWKNYGNSHTIFDASASTSPDGTAVNNTNSQNAWTPSYPTLMGWNGSNTYGLRVDAARVSDNTTGNAATVGGLSAGSFMQYQGFTLDGNTMTPNRSGFTYSVNAPFTGPIVHFDASNYGLQINSAYSASGIGYRTRNGDNGTWNPWREFITTANYTSYGDNLGNHTATTTLNVNYNHISNVADIYCTNNYGQGLVGVYSDVRYQNVFAMGTSWRLPADGSTPGNLYGLSWTHSNVGGQSKSGLSHQLLVMENGITKVALGTGIWTQGNLTFNDANPSISAPSYFVAPGGAYFNSGTVYTEAQYQCRGGIHNDNAGDLTIAGGTSGTTYFGGSISGMSGSFPANNMIRLTPNLHLNSVAGNAVILNWDNGTTGNTQTLRIGDGASTDVFNVWASGNTSIGTTPSASYKLYTYGNQLTANGDGQASIYGYRTRDSQNDGSDYGIYSTNSAITGYNFWGDMYTFGVHGASFGDYTRTGGVLGSVSGTSAWGCLGYKYSDGTLMGVYGIAVWQGGSGYMIGENTQAGIGSGFYGGIIGSWARGEVMGQVSSGELFADYNIGNSYTSGVSSDIVTLENKRVAVYSVTSNDVKVYADGSGQLVNGKCNVQFDRSFTEVISKEGKPTITVTPNGECNGLFTIEITSNGFTVKELNNGNANIEFSWIAIGKRVDANKVNNLPDALKDKDFDNNMKGVMFNENNKEKNATPVWWDGTKIRFDALPEDKTLKKKKEILNEDKKGLSNPTQIWNEQQKKIIQQQPDKNAPVKSEWGNSPKLQKDQPSPPLEQMPGSLNPVGNGNNSPSGLPNNQKISPDNKLPDANKIRK